MNLTTPPAEALQIDERFDHARAIVAFGGKGPDGQDMVQHGTYFATMDAGRIKLLVGFVGLGAPE